MQLKTINSGVDFFDYNMDYRMENRMDNMDNDNIDFYDMDTFLHLLSINYMWLVYF